MAGAAGGSGGGGGGNAGTGEPSKRPLSLSSCSETTLGTSSLVEPHLEELFSEPEAP